MKRIVLTIAFAAMCSAAVFAGGKQDGTAGGLTLEKGVLNVGIEIGYPPFEYYDTDGKTPIGFDVSMGKALAEKLGLKINFIDTAWDGIFAGVSTDKYDCIMSAVTITDERREVHNFTRPYIGNAQAIVLLKNSPLAVRSPEDMAGRRVTYQAETTSDIFVTKLAEDGLNISVFEYDKVMNCFDELRLGRVDVIVCDSMVAVDYVNAADSPFVIVWQGPSDEQFGICLKKGNDALTAALDGALDALFADGTMKRISQEVFKMDLVSSVRN